MRCRIHSLYTCRGSASHASPGSLYVTQRFNMIASLSKPSPNLGPNLAFCTNSSFSFSFSDYLSRSSPSPTTMKSSPCTTMSKSRVACPNAHGLSKPANVCTNFPNEVSPSCCYKKCHTCIFFSNQHRSVSRRCEDFTYVSVSASACRNARLATSTISCRLLPVFDSVAPLHITSRTSANGGVPAK